MKQLSFEQSKHLLKKYDIEIVDSELTDSAAHAVKAAMKMGFPVAMKVDSPDIIHKTDAHCVFTNVNSVLLARKNYDEIIRNAERQGAKVNSVIVQKMVKGKEIIIGAKRDPQFGPTVLFGLGGISVELMKDVSIRVAPVSKSMALEMIKEIKGYPLLSGFRGEKPVDIVKIAELIARVSNLMMDNGEVLEIDLNPCFALNNDCVPVDARIMVL